GGVEQDKWHLVEFSALQEAAQMQRIGVNQIEVGVAEAGVELDRHFLAVGDLQCRYYQEITQRFRGQPDFAFALRLVFDRPKRGGCFIPRNPLDVQSGAVGNDTFQPDVTSAARTFDPGDKGVVKLSKCRMLYDEFLGERFQAHDEFDAKCQHRF